MQSPDRSCSLKWLPGPWTASAPPPLRKPGHFIPAYAHGDHDQAVAWLPLSEGKRAAVYVTSTTIKPARFAASTRDSMPSRMHRGLWLENRLRSDNGISRVRGYLAATVPQSRSEPAYERARKRHPYVIPQRVHLHGSQTATATRRSYRGPEVGGHRGSRFWHGPVLLPAIPLSET